MIGLPRSTYYRRRQGELAAGDGIAASTGPVPPQDTLVGPGERSDPDATLREAIVAIRQTHPAYGYRRVTEVLRSIGLRINTKRVRRVLRALLAPPLPRRTRWMGKGPDDAATGWYPNRPAGMTSTGPDQRWVADLTYL
jgi:putative transposase